MLASQTNLYLSLEDSESSVTRRNNQSCFCIHYRIVGQSITEYLQVPVLGGGGCRSLLIPHTLMSQTKLNGFPHPVSDLHRQHLHVIFNPTNIQICSLLWTKSSLLVCFLGSTSDFVRLLPVVLLLFLLEEPIDFKKDEQAYIIHYLESIYIR